MCTNRKSTASFRNRKPRARTERLENRFLFDAIPSPFIGVSIGNANGSAVASSSSTFVLVGMGDLVDSTTTADQFEYVYTSVGTTALSVNVSLGPASGSANTVGGLVARESLDPGSPEVGYIDTNSNVYFFSRETADGPIDLEPLIGQVQPTLRVAYLNGVATFSDVGYNLLVSDDLPDFHYLGMVAGSNTAGQLGQVTFSNVAMTPALPSVPENVTTELSSTGIQISWDAGSQTAQYLVYRSTAPGIYYLASPLGTVNAGSATTFLDTTAVSGTTYYYSVVATNADGQSDPSSVVSAVAFSGPSITQQPVDQTVQAGIVADFSATAIGSPAPSVQWQVSTDGGNSFSDIAGATSMDYTLTATTAAIGEQFRAHFSSSAGDVYSEPATLTVTTPTSTLTATLAAATLKKTQTSYQFTVTFTDTIAIETSTLGKRNIMILGPDGYSAYATLASFASSKHGQKIVVTYRIKPTGSHWSASSNGTYHVYDHSHQVEDKDGDFAVGALIGDFKVHI